MNSIRHAARSRSIQQDNQMDSATGARNDEVGHELFRQATELFQTIKQNISKHIQAIYDDQELNEQATVNQQLTVQKEGEREVSRENHCGTEKTSERREP